MTESLFYVEHKGHRWAMMASDHRSLEQATMIARLSCKDARETIVWDCSNSPSGVAVLRLASDGTELPLEALR